MKPLYVLCTLCILISMMAVAQAADKTPRTFALGSLGTLTLPVDPGWREIPAPPNSAPAVTLESESPNRFQLLLTPYPVAKGKTQSESDVRTLVEKMARDFAPNSVEKNLPVTGIAGTEAKGFVFHATDPSPAPGEYRMIYQGALADGSVLMTFTVYYNDGAEADSKSALASVQAMHYVPAK